MAVALTDYKFTLRFTADTTGETSTRSISGINIKGESATSGPTTADAISTLANTLTSFSTATFSDWRWIIERGVTL